MKPGGPIVYFSRACEYSKSQQLWHAGGSGRAAMADGRWQMEVGENVGGRNCQRPSKCPLECHPLAPPGGERDSERGSDRRHLTPATGFVFIPTALIRPSATFSRSRERRNERLKAEIHVIQLPIVPAHSAGIPDRAREFAAVPGIRHKCARPVPGRFPFCGRRPIA